MSLGIGAEVHKFGIRVSIVSPGVFATGIGGKLWPASRDVGEPYYREKVEQIVGDWNAIVGGRDPIAVARAIESCLHDDEPPARVFVGRDSERGAAMRRQMSDDEWAAHLLKPLLRRPEAPKEKA